MKKSKIKIMGSKYSDKMASLLKIVSKNKMLLDNLSNFFR